MNSSNLKARTRAMLIQTKENKISQLKDYLSYAAVNFVLLRDTEFRYNNPLEQSCFKLEQCLLFHFCHWP